MLMVLFFMARCVYTEYIVCGSVDVFQSSDADVARCSLGQHYADLRCYTTLSTFLTRGKCEGTGEGGANSVLY